jgi:hypothetical protein
MHLSARALLVALLAPAALAATGLPTPATVDFESWGLGCPGTPQGGWFQSTKDDLDWTIAQGPTGTAGTGPDGGHVGVGFGGRYVYTDTWSPMQAGDEAVLQSPAYDTSTLTAPAVTFWYHLYGSTTGSLHLDQKAGPTSTLYTITGQQQSGSGVPWRQTPPIPCASGTGIVFHLRGEIGGLSYGDMAIDDFQIIDLAAAAPDVGVLSVDAPPGNCTIGGAGTVTVTIENHDVIPVTGFDVQYEITAGPIAPQGPFTETVGSWIPSSGQATFTFATTADFSSPGSYTVVARTLHPGDVDGGNDQGPPFSVDTSPIAGPYPGAEDFETFTVGDPTTVGAPGTFASDWIQVQDGTDQLDWTVYDRPTPSSSTGPSADHTTGAGRYLFLEADAGASGEEAHAVSDCYALAPLTSPVVTFWYHMYGGTMGALHLEVLNVSTGIWTTEWSQVGQVQTSSTDPWLRTPQIDLAAAYAGQVVAFRLVAVRGGASLSDIAVDDFAVQDAFADPDVGVVSLDDPTSDCTLGAGISVTVTLENTSTAPITGFDVSFETWGPVSQGPVIETVAATLPAGGTLAYTFSTLADFSGTGEYDVWIETSLFGDINGANDLLHEVILSSQEVAGPYPHVESFETFSVGSPGTLDNGWLRSAADLDWTVDCCGTPTANTGPDHDLDPGHDVGRYLYLRAASGSFSGQEAHLLSPCFELTGLTDPVLDYGYYMYGADMGTLHVDVRPGGGAWTLDVDQLVGPQQTTAGDDWRRSILLDLTPFAPVCQVRFRAERGAGAAGDMAIDAVRVFNDDLGGAGCLPPGLACGDCDENGFITIVDALQAARSDAGLTTLTAGGECACNVLGAMFPDPGASVSILDALTIAQYVVGLVTLGCGGSGGPALGCTIASPLSGAFAAEVPVEFEVTAGARVDLSFDYSTDGGASWWPAAASPLSPIANPFIGDLPGSGKQFTWDSLVNVPDTGGSTWPESEPEPGPPTNDDHTTAENLTGFCSNPTISGEWLSVAGVHLGLNSCELAGCACSCGSCPSLPSHSHQPWGDMDWYRFTGDAGALFTLDLTITSHCCWKHPCCDSFALAQMAWVFNGAGNLIASTLDPYTSPTYPGVLTVSIGPVTLPSTGTYYIYVGDWSRYPRQATYAGTTYTPIAPGSGYLVSSTSTDLSCPSSGSNDLHHATYDCSFYVSSGNGGPCAGGSLRPIQALFRVTVDDGASTSTCVTGPLDLIP